MSKDVENIRAELEVLGYDTAVRDSGQGTVVEFDYEVETGTKRGNLFRIGISMHKGTYPEYPPHWIHVSPPVSDGLTGGVQPYQTNDGRQWVAMSRPPSDLWDRLPNKDKDMRNYLQGHVRRFWSHI